MVRSEKKYDRSRKLLASLNCSERTDFEDDCAISLATSGSKTLHFIFFPENCYSQ